MIEEAIRKMIEINPNNAWSVANGGIKLVELTKEKLADFENFKKEAEALYGAADDPYANSGTATGARPVIYAFRLNDVDPASWLPQWVKPGDTFQEPPDTELRERMESLLTVNGEHGREQLRWSKRVLESWLAKQNAGGTASETSATASSSAVLAAQRTYDRTTASAA